jgi:hypothetical protein
VKTPKINQHPWTIAKLLVDFGSFSHLLNYFSSAKNMHFGALLTEKHGFFDRLWVIFARLKNIW